MRLPWLVGDALIDSAVREPLHPFDLNTERLADQALARELRQVLARVPRARCSLASGLTACLDPMISALESQAVWRYGLRACGHVLQVALVETLGPRRQLWELSLSRSGQIEAVLEDGWLLSAGQFVERLQELSHVS